MFSASLIDEGMDSNSDMADSKYIHMLCVIVMCQIYYSVTLEAKCAVKKQKMASIAQKGEIPWVSQKNKR